MDPVLDQIVCKIYAQLQQDGIEFDCILPNIEGLNFEEIENWWKGAELIFRDNDKQKCLAYNLYQVWKLGLTLKCENFSPKDYQSACSIIYSFWEEFKSEFPEMMRILLQNVEKGIESSNLAKEMIEWWKIVKRIEEIDKEKSNLFKQIIRSRFYFLCTEGAKENPKNVLLFLAYVEIADEIDVNDLVKLAMEHALGQVEKEQKAYTSESWSSFKEEVEELLRIIDAIEANKHIRYDLTETKQNIREIIRMLENNQNKALLRNSEHEQSENYCHKEAYEDIPLDRAKITQEICLPFKYSDNYLEIRMYQGILDNREKACIKYFFVSSEKHYEIFMKEKEIIKLLSEKHACFLKYYGWFNCVWSENDQNFNAYAIVTEYFKTVLIEDIVHHSKYGVKYTLNWLLKIVQDLLEAFYYFEKSNIKHFNIRPQNILVSEDNRLKISGFNFGWMDFVSWPIEKNNEIWRDSYLAPEIYDSQGYNMHDVTSVMKAGVFSLGLIFLQIYSLCSISELNTPKYYEEINDYVSTFKPKIVADLLREMLKINKNERKSFNWCLNFFLRKEEKKEECQDISSQNLKTRHKEIKKIIKRLKKIDSSHLIVEERHLCFEKSKNSSEIIFKKGTYKNNDVLIRAFNHEESEKLLPFLEEAEILEKLDNKSTAFIKYYGLEWLKNKEKLIYSLSLITELCEDDLMTEMILKLKNHDHYNEERLKFWFELLLRGFSTLKKAGCDHDNISPYAFLFNKSRHIKISRFLTPKYKIESLCMIPKYESHPNQMSSYFSPEKLNSIKIGNRYDIEISDVYSLGLVFLNMHNLATVDNWNYERDFPNLQLIKPTWLARLLQAMLFRGSSWTYRFDEILEKMHSYIKDDQAC